MKNESGKNRRLGVVLGVAWILSLGASVAFAGEITGNGKSLKNDDGTLNGKSLCAFSGREDAPESGDFKSAIAQAWGQLPKAARDFLTSIGMNPGIACNPTTSSGE
jgi:hypothetical protein